MKNSAVSYWINHQTKLVLQTKYLIKQCYTYNSNNNNNLASELYLLVMFDES